MIRPVENAIRELPEAQVDTAPVVRKALEHSTGSLDYFSTRDDRRATVGGEAFVSWRPMAPRVALVGGDPIGPREDWSTAIHAFAEQAHREHRAIAVMGCSADAAEAWGEAGFKRLYLGDEAVLDLNSFTLAGGSMKSVRQSANRVAKAGYVAEASRIKDLTPDQVTQMRALSDGWRAGQPERGYSMTLGRVLDAKDGDAVVVYAKDSQGKIQGFLQFAPWGEDGVSLDVMRRDRNGHRDLNDFLIAKGTELLSGEAFGMKKMSLNFATLRAALVKGADENAPRAERLKRRILLKASKWLQLESLRLYNEKFSPDWVPRYAMVKGPMTMLPSAFAAVHAEGFLDPRAFMWTSEKLKERSGKQPTTTA